MSTTMTDQARRAAHFLALHNQQAPLLMPNAWDQGSAKVLAWLGFEALATTSSGSAASVGRLDGSLKRDEALAHAMSLVHAVDVPVSADLENCFADDPQGVAATVERALATGLAGCSVEDYSGRRDDPIYDASFAAERVAAACGVAHAGPVHMAVTARAENHIHGRTDVRDTIDRLQRYARAGADVLFAPGIARAEDIRAIVESVDRPVSVLAFPGCPPVAELGALGVRRVSVGGAFAFAALAALVEAATELRDEGTYGYLQRSRAGVEVVRAAFTR